MWWRRRQALSGQKHESVRHDQPARGGKLNRSAPLPSGPLVEHLGLTAHGDTSTENLLDFQHFLLRRHLKANHQSPLQDPRNILDVGCGTGRWVIEMAVEFPNAKVVGLDLNAPRDTAPMLAPLGPRAANVSFIEADLLAGLPFPDASFDFVHFRLMYMDVPAPRWPDVIRELVRVTRPWGWVECVEPAEDVYNPGPAYRLMGEWIATLCRRRDFDPDAGPKLKQWLRSAGLVSVAERQAVLFPDLTLTRERRLWMTQSLGVYDLVREPMLAMGITSPEHYDIALQAVRREFEQGTHANCDVLHIAFGQKPPS